MTSIKNIGGQFPGSTLDHNWRIPGTFYRYLVRWGSMRKKGKEDGTASTQPPFYFSHTFFPCCSELTEFLKEPLRFKMFLTVDVVTVVDSCINLINKNLMYDMISITQEPCQQRLQALICYSRFNMQCPKICILDHTFICFRSSLFHRIKNFPLSRNRIIILFISIP